MEGNCPSNLGLDDGHRLRCCERRVRTSTDRPTLIRMRSGLEASGQERLAYTYARKYFTAAPTCQFEGVDVSRPVGGQNRLNHYVTQRELRARFKCA